MSKKEPRVVRSFPMSSTHAIPEKVQPILRNLETALNFATMQRRTYLDGIIGGMGIDVEGCEVNVNLDAMQFIITPMAKVKADGPQDNLGDDASPPIQMAARSK